MIKIRARTLLQYSTQQLHEMLTGHFILVFDDDRELEVTARQTLFSSYVWDYIRDYPEVRLVPEYHVASILKTGILSTRTHTILLARVYWAVIDTYRIIDKTQRYDLLKRVYQIVNTIYNDLSELAEPYVVSIDVLDFVKVIEHPIIKAANESVQPTPESLSETYDAIIQAFNTPELKNNSLARAARSGVVKSLQVLQCVGPRGFVYEVDGYKLPTPVLRGYAHGYRDLYDLVADSRTAAKALYSSDGDIKDSEYFARRLQLNTMVLDKLHTGDCGSTRYLDWHLKGPTEADESNQHYSGDLNYMEGKYYLDPDTQTLKVLTVHDTHLYGRLLRLRSPLFCQHPDPHSFCSVCVGRIEENIPPHANLGHIASATITKQTTQSVLSSKHLTSSAVIEPIMLNKHYREFFRIGKDGGTYYLNPELAKKDFSILLSNREVYGLTDILLVDDVRTINNSLIGEIDWVTFVVRVGDVPETTPIPVNQQKRKALLTYEFLEYLKEHPWRTDNEGNLIFDFTHWDYDTPMLVLLEMEYSYSKHSKDIAALIESKMEMITERNRPESPATTLRELFYLINSKMFVNLSILEIMIYSIMIKSNDGVVKDYGMARGHEQAGLAVTKSLIKYRSLAPLYAYQYQERSIVDPYSFFKFNRPDHPLDVFVDPEGVASTRRRRK